MEYVSSPKSNYKLVFKKKHKHLWLSVRKTKPRVC